MHTASRVKNSICVFYRFAAQMLNCTVSASVTPSRRRYAVLLGRPNVSSEGLIFYCWCFFLFFYFFRHAIFELRPPIAAKLCHMIAIWVRFIIQVQKFGGPSPQRNWGRKTCKIRRDFRQLQTSIANISGKGQDIQNRKEICSVPIPPAFHEESPVNFGPQTTEN